MKSALERMAAAYKEGVIDPTTLTMVHLTAVTNSMMTALVYLLTGQVHGQPT